MRDLYFYHEIEDMFEDLLNESYETVKICGFDYEQGSALRQLDPIAFGCEVSNYESDDFEELHFSDLTEDEKEHYCATEKTIMYCRNEDL